METQVKEGKYLYCVIESNEVRSFGPLGIGGRGDELYTIHFNDIAAVVSNSPIKTYAISRDNTFAHENAIEEVMKKHAVLPIRFSTITENEEKVKSILEKEYSKFKELFEKIKDKKELGFMAIFRKDVIYREILNVYENIRILKEKIIALPPEKTYHQRREIGNLVEQALIEQTEKYKEEILDVLAPLADEIKENNTYGEGMILNAAFLVKKSKEPDFDKKVNELDEKFENMIKFKYTGAIPPFNFVNIVIKTGEY